MNFSLDLGEVLSEGSDIRKVKIKEVKNFIVK